MTKIVSKKNKDSSAKKSGKPRVLARTVKSGKTGKSSVAKVKVARVRIKYVHMAPRKVRRIANLLRSISVLEAENILANLHKRAVGPLSKALGSAKANAVTNQGMDEKKLFISEISVNESLSLSRFRPRAQGRAFPIKKRFAHIDISVREQELPETTTVKKNRIRRSGSRINKVKSLDQKNGQNKKQAKKVRGGAVITNTKMK